MEEYDKDGAYIVSPVLRGGRGLKLGVHELARRAEMVSPVLRGGRGLKLCGCMSMDAFLRIARP